MWDRGVADNKPGEHGAAAEFWKSWGSAGSGAAGLCVYPLVAHELTHCGSDPHSCVGLPDRRSLGLRHETSGQEGLSATVVQGTSLGSR